MVVARKARRLPAEPRPSRAADRAHDDDDDDDGDDDDEEMCLLPPPRRMRPLEGAFGGGGDVNAMAADVDVARIIAEAAMNPRTIVMIDSMRWVDLWVASVLIGRVGRVG